MALSFEDSLKAAQAESKAAAAVAAVPAVAEDASVMTLDYGVADYGIAADETSMIAAYSGDDGSWLQVTGQDYDFYDEYNDENISSIDDEKYIKLNQKQFNITQETNSQYIPFEMPRYYDGFDLTTAKLQIHFVNSRGHGGIDYPANVYYNDEKIRFGWLVDSRATQVEGKLSFEIQAIGKNSKNEDYIWKSRSTDKLNVVESLTSTAYIEPDSAWQESFMARIEGQVVIAQNNASLAQTAANQAMNQARAAAASAQAAQDAVDTLQDQIDELVDESVDSKIGTVVDDKVDEAMVNYYTKDEVYTSAETDDKIQEVVDAIPEVDLTDYATKSYVSDELESYYTKEEVDTAIENVDVSGQLGDLGTDEEGNPLTVVQYIEEKVADVDVSDQLGNLGTNADGSDRTVVQYVQNELANIELDDYTTLEVHNDAISGINKDITELNNIIDTIDKSPNATYYTTYGESYISPEDGQEKDGTDTLVLYEVIGNGTPNATETVVATHLITGGSGGTSSNIILRVEPITPTNSVAFTVNDKVEIEFNFTAVEKDGDYEIDLGEGYATWTLNDKTIVKNHRIKTGYHIVDLTEHFNRAVNDQKLTLIYSDGLSTRKKISWYVSIVDVRIESTFSDEKTYAAGRPIGFTYTPYGGVDKTIHFVLDGDVDKEVTQDSPKAAANRQTTYTIPAQSHGSHLFDAYLTAVINGKTIESNHIIKDFIWYDANETTPVIGCAQQKFTARQYETTNITYSVYDPLSEAPEVLLSATYVDENGEVVEEYSSTIIMTSNTGYWQYRSDIVGEHTLTITCRDTVKTLKATVEKLNIDVDPVIANLAFDFNPIGYSNNDIDRLWSYESSTEERTVSMSVSDNFDWVNGGYQIDSNGDSYFCIKAGTTATIDYKMFCQSYNIKSQGSHYKLVFKTTKVQNAAQPFLQCYKNNVGVIMKPQETNFYAGSGNHLYLAYSEDDIIEFELNMGEKVNDSVKMVMGYEDGVATKPLVYTDGATFIQGIVDDDAEYITLGSTSCDLHIYRFKAYRKALDSTEILRNFILDTRNSGEMIKRYDRNQIYEEGSNDTLTPEYLAKACPNLRIIMISAPIFTKDKSHKVPNTTIQCIYKNGRELEDNWTAYNCMHSGQGTSSNLYGAAGRNIDLIMNKENEDGVYPWIEFGDLDDGGYALGDGSEKVLKVNLTETSVPIDYLNIKVNIASSENANNALLAKRYNEYNPYKRPFVREEGYAYDIKDTMEFQNCVVFICETDETQDANGNYINHNEFNDTDWHFYGIGNIGDSKKTDDTRMNDPDDVNEFVVEIMDNNLPNSKFQSGVEDEKGYSITGSEIEAIWQTYKNNTFEPESGDKYIPVTNSIYLLDENLPIFYELIDGEYVLTSDESIISDKTYYEINYPNTAYSGLYKDKYYRNSEGEVELESGWGISFECRYEHDDSDHDEHRRIWNEFYEFVIFSDDTEFKEKLGDYCVLESVMFYYLFTLRYTMIDNRAKNSFWHYGKCADGVYRWDLTMDYDNDTSLGIDNFGKQVFRYGYEDIDYVDSELEDAGAESRTWVFNAATSTFYKRLRDLFSADMKNLYNNLDDNTLAWKAEDLITQWDNFQSQFPEELWRKDIQRKYIRTYTSAFKDDTTKADPSFLKEKMNGRKKYHRKQFERNQEKYMASKFRTTDAKNDIIRMRAKPPSGNLTVPADFDLTLTPYTYMYVSVDYGNGRAVLQERAVPNVPVKLDYPLDSGDIIAIENASNLISVGDLSPLYTEEGVFSSAIRLKDLTLGNPTMGYSNTALQSLNMVEDGLLEVLNIENIPSLDDELDLGSLRNLKTVKAKGSGIQGLTLAKNGAAETLSLPSSLGVLKMSNLRNLKDIDIDSLDSLTRLTIEDCDFSAIDNFVIGDIKYEPEITIIKDVEYHTPNEIAIIENALNLERVRMTGINWNLPNTDLLERLYSPLIGGYDANGGESINSVLEGNVYVPSIKQSEYIKYTTKWDINIQYGSWIPQYEVIFKNYNPDTDELEIIERQWVDAAQYPSDPTKRAENRIEPCRTPTVSTEFKFAGWSTDGTVGKIVEDITTKEIRNTTVYIAAYTESVRNYTVKYVMDISGTEEVLDIIDKAPYGSVASYGGEIPVYTGGENKGDERFYLFSNWDQSSLVDGDKTIKAEFDECIYTDGMFEDEKMELHLMKPVELYALTRLVEIGVLQYNPKENSITESLVEIGDDFSFTMGYDYDSEYDFYHDDENNDIESYTLIRSKTRFDGNNYIDFNGSTPIYKKNSEGELEEVYKEIKLFDEDKDFVLAIDYNLSSELPEGQESGTFVQCFQTQGSNGFKLGLNSNRNPEFTFGGGKTEDEVPVLNHAANSREMIVIRHTAGDNNLYVYTSSFNLPDVERHDIIKEILTESSTATLVFGASKADFANAMYVNNCIGDINWSKIWYKDLGDDICKKLACWTHEEIGLEVSGFYRYALHDDFTQASTLSLIARHLLDRKMKWNNSDSNAGGWASSALKNFLNTRFYNAIPTQIKSIIKNVSVSSVIGNNSAEISSSGCYVNIPALYDVNDSPANSAYKNEVSDMNGTIKFLNTPDTRKRAFIDGTFNAYWLRSPAIGTWTTGYVWRVDENGNTQQVTSPNSNNSNLGVLIELSF